MALEIPLKKSNLGQKSSSVVGPSIWNKWSNNLKVVKTTTSFTHNYKKLVLQNLNEKNSILIITFNHYYYQKTFYYCYYCYFLSLLLLLSLL